MDPDIKRLLRMLKIWAAQKGWRLASNGVAGRVGDGYQWPVPSSKGRWLVAVLKGDTNKISLVHVSTSEILKAQD